MNLTLARKELAKALEFAARVAQKRTTIPIISNICLTAANGRLTLAATDLDIEAQTSLAAEISVDGAITVPASTFSDIIRKLAGEQVTLFLDSAVDAGRLTIKSGRSKFHLATLPASDWPSLEIGEMSHRFTLPAATIARALKKTSFAISNEETRYYLNGVYVHAAQGNIHFVATDGHRLAKFSAPVPQGADGMPGVIVPTRACAELARLAEAIAKDSASGRRMPEQDAEDSGALDIELSDRKILFRAGETTILSKLIDGSFPDYDRVIPKANDKVATVVIAELGPALERVSTIVSDRGRGVKLSLADGALSLQVTNPDMGDAAEELEVAYDAPQIEIGFNARYVGEALAAIDGATARLELNEPGSPAILRANPDADLIVVLMPMRI